MASDTSLDAKRTRMYSRDMSTRAVSGRSQAVPSMRMQPSSPAPRWRCAYSCVRRATAAPLSAPASAKCRRRQMDRAQGILRCASARKRRSRKQWAELSTTECFFPVHAIPGPRHGPPRALPERSAL